MFSKGGGAQEGEGGGGGAHGEGGGAWGVRGKGEWWPLHWRESHSDRRPARACGRIPHPRQPGVILEEAAAVPVPHQRWRRRGCCELAACPPARPPTAAMAAMVWRRLSLLPPGAPTTPAPSPSRVTGWFVGGPRRADLGRPASVQLRCSGGGGLFPWERRSWGLVGILVALAGLG